MPTKRPKKRKTSRPITPQAGPRQASALESVPERGKLLDRLAERVKGIGNFGKMQVVKNPPGEEKMSDVLKEFIRPYTRLATDTPSYERLVAAALVAWNAALTPPDERARLLAEVSQSFDAESREDFYAVVGELIKRKERHFARYTRQIIDAQVTDLGDSYHLAVVSLLKPPS